MIWGILLLICLAITPLIFKYRWFRNTVFFVVPILMLVSLAVMKAAILALKVLLFILAPTVGRRTDGSLPPERMYYR